MKILLLTYRGNPFCGGQGVYVTHLAQELVRQGHEVHCLQGPPYSPEADGIVWHRVPGPYLPSAALEGAGDANADTSNGGANGAEQPGGGSNGRGSNGSRGWGAAPGTGSSPWAALRPINLLERGLATAGQFPEMHTFSWHAFNAVRGLLRQHRFDVIHDNQTLGWGLLPMRALGVPLVATIHHPLTIDRSRGFDSPASFARRLSMVRFYPTLMQGFVARRMSHVVTVSDASAADIARDFRVSPERIRVVHNGIDAQRFRPRPEIARAPGRIVYVGNLEDGNKGGVYLLRALARLPSAHLVIATSGISRRPWLDGLLDALNLRDRVTLRLRLDAEQLVDLYASAEVAVSPSLYEGFGFPAGEAMACGLPVVAARGGALPEVVGDAGVLVPIADEVALAEALRSLLADAPRRERLGQAARDRVLASFRWEDAARRTADVYAEAIHAHH